MKNHQVARSESTQILKHHFSVQHSKWSSSHHYPLHVSTNLATCYLIKLFIYTGSLHPYLQRTAAKGFTGPQGGPSQWCSMRGLSLPVISLLCIFKEILWAHLPSLLPLRVPITAGWNVNKSQASCCNSFCFEKQNNTKKPFKSAHVWIWASLLLSCITCYLSTCHSSLVIISKALICSTALIEHLLCTARASSSTGMTYMGDKNDDSFPQAVLRKEFSPSQLFFYRLWRFF